MPVRGPTPSNTAANFIMILVIRMSEKARWENLLGSQKNVAFLPVYRRTGTAP
jgi:hypothetical protein